MKSVVAVYPDGEEIIELYDDDAAVIAAEPANPQAWATAMVHSLSLGHEVEMEEVLAFFTAFKEVCQTPCRANEGQAYDQG